MSNLDSSYNKRGLYFLLGTIGINFLFIGYLSIFQTEIDLKEQVQIQNLNEDPVSELWVSTEALVQKGKSLYKAQCALCHGLTGLGDGSPGLTPPPRNLVEGKWKVGNGSAQHLFTVLIQGIPNTSMVSFKHLPKADRWSLVHYIRSITKNKVTDDPKILGEFAKKSL